MRIAAGDAVFAQKGYVAEAVNGRRVVLKIRRQIEGDLRIGPGNYIQPFAVVVVPGDGARGRNLAQDVGARHLDQTGGGGDERNRPGGLLGLRGRSSLEPMIVKAARGSAR
jgi:hypothetical protein